MACVLSWLSIHLQHLINASDIGLWAGDDQ